MNLSSEVYRKLNLQLLFCQRIRLHKPLMNQHHLPRVWCPRRLRYEPGTAHRCLVRPCSGFRVWQVPAALSIYFLNNTFAIKSPYILITNKQLVVYSSSKKPVRTFVRFLFIFTTFPFQSSKFKRIYEMAGIELRLPNKQPSEEILLSHQPLVSYYFLDIPRHCYNSWPLRPHIPLTTKGGCCQSDFFDNRNTAKRKSIPNKCSRCTLQEKLAFLLPYRSTTRKSG